MENPWFPSGSASAFSPPLDTTGDSRSLVLPHPPNPPDPSSPFPVTHYPPLSSSSTKTTRRSLRTALYRLVEKDPGSLLTPITGVAVQLQMSLKLDLLLFLFWIWEYCSWSSSFWTFYHTPTKRNFSHCNQQSFWLTLQRQIFPSQAKYHSTPDPKPSSSELFYCKKILKPFNPSWSFTSGKIEKIWR